MNRKEFMQYCLSLQGNTPLSPVQLQKLFFLIDMKLSREVGGPFFHFTPYHYGPFDKEVYEELDNLNSENKVEIIQNNRLRLYKLTEEGKNTIPISNLNENVKSKVEDIIDYVKTKSFTELISAIYHDYPGMRVNSVFNT